MEAKSRALAFKRIKQTGAQFVRRINEQKTASASVVIAYYALLSLFPLLIVVGAVLPYFRIDYHIILFYLDTLIPAPILEQFAPLIESLLTVPNGGALSLGILGTIWSASRGMNRIQLEMDRAFGLESARPYLSSRIAALPTLILMLLLLVLILLSLSFGEALLRHFTGLYAWVEAFHRYFDVLKWPIAFVAVFIVCCAVYMLTTSLRLHFRHVWAGALMVSLASLLLAWGFALYLLHFSQSQTAYGLLGGFFMLMVWIRMLAYLLLSGAVLNATLMEQKGALPHKRERWLDRMAQKLHQSLALRLKRRKQL